MATNQMSYDIVSGPSREQLFDGLRLRSELAVMQPRLVPFTIKEDGREITLDCVVNGITDDETQDPNYILALDAGSKATRRHGRMRAVYNARLRTGHAWPLSLKERGPFFFFGKAFEFPGTGNFHIQDGQAWGMPNPGISSLLGSRVVNWKGCFKNAFDGYGEVAANKRPMVICEFLGNPKNGYIQETLGRRSQPSLGEVLWAVDSDIVEPNWHYAAHVSCRGFDYMFHILKTYEDETLKIEINCRGIDSEKERGWASNIRFLCRNQFCPQVLG